MIFGPARERERRERLPLHAFGEIADGRAAFEEPVPRERFPFECLTFEQEGRVVRFVVRGEREEIVSALKALSPIFVEEIKVDFEELFLCEVKSRGYLS